MLPSNARIYVATAPIDMRRSFDGLAAVVMERMQPCSCIRGWRAC